MEHVVVIIPVDADINETEHVTQKDRYHWLQGGELAPIGSFHFEDHDCDDDGDHAVTECFEPVVSHSPRISKWPLTVSKSKHWVFRDRTRTANRPEAYWA